MAEEILKLKIHSFETFGTVDGPGIRFVVFLKGCPLRCKYCHNPDTWNMEEGRKLTPKEVSVQVLRYKNYIASGGVTVSGGEPLLQAKAVAELFRILKKNKVHTCLDTSGGGFKPEELHNYETLIANTDLFLLDIKHMDPVQHKWLTGEGNENILEFARLLNSAGKKMWLRHVLVPGITDSEEHLRSIAEFAASLSCVEKIELLPYHTLGQVKYEKLGMEYPLKGIPTPTKEEVYRAKEILGIIK